MGNVCCAKKSSAALASSPLTSPAQLPLPLPSSNDAYASALFNACASAATPALKLGLGHAVLNWEEAGGILLHEFSDEWTLHIRRCGEQDVFDAAASISAAGASALSADEIVKGLSVECTSCELREALDPPAGNPSWLGVTSQLVCFDAVVCIELDLKDNIAFEVRAGNNMLAGIVDEVSLLHGRISATFRCYLNPAAQQLRVVILSPHVDWDIEVKLLLGMPLPDWLEDGVMARALERRLAAFTHDQPLEVDLAEKRALGADAAAQPSARGNAVSAQEPALRTDRVGYLLEEGLPAVQPTATTGYQKKKRRSSSDKQWRKAAAPPLTQVI